jgi:arylformamidase
MMLEQASQEEIDREYNPRLGIPDVDALIAGWAERSAATRSRLPCRRGVRFGPTLAEHADVFPAPEGRAPAPVHVFIHGGYWRAFSAADFSFVAESAFAEGHAAVIVNYALCPGVSITEIVRQARAAVAWTWANAPSFGGDRERIVVSGHSAGGHLAARVAATAWSRDYGIPDDVVKGVLAISGLFDLEPVRRCWLQPILQITGDEVLEQSPMRRPPEPGRPPLLVAVGAEETPEFRRQSRDFATLLKGPGCRELEGRNHFDVLDDLADPAGILWRDLVRIGFADRGIGSAERR